MFADNQVLLYLVQRITNTDEDIKPPPQQTNVHMLLFPKDAYTVAKRWPAAAKLKKLMEISFADLVLIILII